MQTLEQNLALLASAKAIVTEREGVRPTVTPVPDYGYSAVTGAAYEARKAAIVAAWKSEDRARAWSRRVRKTFRELDEGTLALAPVVQISPTTVAA